jgi:hypothetical protein
MLDSLLDVAVKLVVPTVTAFGFILIKKGCQILSKKLDVEVNAKEWELIERIVEEAVRAVEEDSRTNTLSSEDKEELALARIRQSFKNGFGNPYEESVIRIKVKACVNKLYNHSRIK